MKKEFVILVNKNNKKIGIEEKIKAHKLGKLHRSFSIFVFNSKGELLIQKRAETKYHSGGLWPNTVCGHPRPNENYAQAIHRRLKEEMGFDCKPKKLFCFIYNAGFKNGLIENEYDCVFIGKFDGKPKLNPEEVMNHKWITVDDLKQDIAINPNEYTAWLKIALQKFILYLVTDGKIPKKKSPSKIIYNAYFDYGIETSKIVDKIIIEAIKKYPLKSFQKELLEPFHERWYIPKIRSTYLRLGYEIVGGKNWEKIATIIAAVDILNTAIYASDDILDLRISDPKFVEKRLLSSHILKNIGFNLLFSIQKEFPTKIILKVLERFNRLLNNQYDGMALEIKKLKENYSKKNYLKRVEYYCFADDILYVAALLGGGTKEEIFVLENFGRNMGIAAMIANDAYDFGKDCEDLKNNILTLPINFLLKKAKGNDLKIIKKVKGNRNATKNDLEKVRKLAVKLGAVEYGQNYAIKYVKRGIKFLSVFPETKQKRLLSYSVRIIQHNKFFDRIRKWQP